MTSKNITFVTGNQLKFENAKRILSNYGIQVFPVQLELPEIQAKTIKEVAVNKALTAALKINRNVVCDDTGILINALNGFPGPYTKFIQEKISSEKIVKFLEEINDKTAVFESVIVYAKPSGYTKTFKTIIEGKITENKRGSHGWGWDTVFELKKTKKTLAEHDSKERTLFWNKGYKDLGKWLKEKKTLK
ncbi:MAG: RdgB/HAM1 family non-canonical purine NTP pyrophosphatase [archaeon]